PFDRYQAPWMLHSPQGPDNVRGHNGWEGGAMAIYQRTSEARASSVDWRALFAARTRSDVGPGLASILELANSTDLISFSGGFPDPATFPGQMLAEILAEIVASGDVTALQYGPTPGLPGPRAFVADRLAAREDRHPAEDELAT